MISLFSFSDNWTDLSISDPKAFVNEVEQRYSLNEDFRRFIDLIRNGAKADRSFQKAKCGIRPGDWIVSPYSPYLVSVLRKAVEKGRLEEERSN
jgi:hypothetical protein